MGVLCPDLRSAARDLLFAALAAEPRIGALIASNIGGGLSNCRMSAGASQSRRLSASAILIPPPPSSPFQPLKPGASPPTSNTVSAAQPSSPASQRANKRASSQFQPVSQLASVAVCFAGAGDAAVAIISGGTG